MKRRALLVLTVLFGFLPSCMARSGKPKRTFAHIVKLMPALSTEEQVISQIRAPDGTYAFNPGNLDDPYAANWAKREDWPKEQVFRPSSLINNLPVGTKMLVYSFSYHPARTGGNLIVYIGKRGEVLGWSYSKSLVGLENDAVLRDAS